MRILVTGSRNWDDEEAIYDALMEVRYTPGERVTLVHGGASGADEIAARLARDMGFHVEVHNAEWKRYGNGAGPIRNLHMVSLGADICLAFIKNKSSGASHCSNAARKAGIPTVIYEPRESRS